MAQDKDIFIQHALNRGEKAFGSYHVDGYTQIDGVETVYEYKGCFFHGCKSCFVPQAMCVLTQKTFGEMYQEFQDKLDSLQATYGLKVEVLWEHEWAALKKSDPHVQAFLSSYDTGCHALLYQGVQKKVRVVGSSIVRYKREVSVLGFSKLF
jgi:hypothetical protein